MQRTIPLTVRATPEDAATLERTAAAFNAACEWISGVACAVGVLRTVPLHHRTYYEARARFGLQAQFVIRAIGVVADAYRRGQPSDRKVRHHFRPAAAVVYDERLLRFEPKNGYQRVSLTTVDGRILCGLAMGGYQRARLGQATKVGQGDLLRDPKGRWRLHLTITLPDPTPASTEGGVLGIDMGICNIATDSDGLLYSGAHLNGLRRRSHRLRKKLQATGTRAARRRLRSWKAKQQRFQRHVNHTISEQLVATARTTHRALAVEALDGITRRLAGTVSRDQRRLLHGWGFFQLRTFLAYQAEAAGIPLYAVDPRHTSQTCPSCGVIDRKNRKTQAAFLCVSCGFAGHADRVAATNIARRGMVVAGVLVNHPHFSEARAVVSHEVPASLGKSCSR
jgi:putative transposase